MIETAVLDERERLPDPPTIASNDPIYGRMIESFLVRTFPMLPIPPGELLDAVTGAVIATGAHRLGPRPSPEGTVAIRQVLSYWIARGEPIAILVPWGSRKPGVSESAGHVDISEMMALRMISCLHERVKTFYPPGVMANLGIEDVGGKYLWADEAGAAETSDRYVADLVTLAQILDPGGLFWPVPESTLVSADVFAEAAERVRPALEVAIYRILSGADADSVLRTIAWKGTLPAEPVHHYLASYDKPAWRYVLPEAGSGTALARYLAQAFARYAVQAKVAFPEWGDHCLNLNFAPPIPGLPRQLADRRLYYRTIPTEYTRTHLPPWRAKGYLSIEEYGIAPRVRTWGNTSDLVPSTVTLQRAGRSVQVLADYAINLGDD